MQLHIPVNRWVQMFICFFTFYLYFLYYFTDEFYPEKNKSLREKSLTVDQKNGISMYIKRLSDLPKNGSVWPVIVMSTKGRLGNALFEYALGFVVQKLFPEAFVGVAENVQSMVQKILEPESLVFPVISKKFIKENEFMFEHNEPDYMKGDMDSFFLPRIQNGVNIFHNNKTLSIIGMEAFPYKILHKYQDYIRNKMPLKKINLNKADKYVTKILQQRFGQVTEALRDDVVAFHIRRKDYLLFSALFHKHGLPGQEYYQRALNFYRQRLNSPTFIVCSDDVEHAKLALQEHKDVVIKDKGSEEEDMSLLASCKHIILTIGTFGFFSALFANAEAVYPVFVNKISSPFANDSSIPTWKVVDYKEENFDNFYGLIA